MASLHSRLTVGIRRSLRKFRSRARCAMISTSVACALVAGSPSWLRKSATIKAWECRLGAHGALADPVRPEDHHHGIERRARVGMHAEREAEPATDETDLRMREHVTVKPNISGARREHHHHGGAMLLRFRARFRYPGAEIPVVWWIAKDDL